MNKIELKYHCYGCGEYVDGFIEGWCPGYCKERQRNLNNHNAQYERGKQEQRDRAIKEAMK